MLRQSSLFVRVRCSYFGEKTEFTAMGSVLDMLNIINGILFVQISQADIENFKKEYETRQKDLPLTKQLER